MKFETAQKAIKANYGKIIKVGYCRLQFLLNCERPIAYTTGRYGWNADIYDIDGVAIVTGYNPFGNIYPDYDICQKYEKVAAEALSRHKDKSFFDDLLKNFIEEVVNNG